jgi:hypothetical protein
MREAKIENWDTLYKVCLGIRNFSVAKAKIAAALTKSDPLMWTDNTRAKDRKPYLKVLEEALNLKYTPKKKPRRTP